jgi:superfamily II RNA helicase
VMHDTRNIFNPTDTLNSMQNLAITYTKLGGRLEEVQKLEEKVLEVRRHTLGEEHPDTLRIMARLAVTYEELGGKLKEVKTSKRMSWK